MANLKVWDGSQWVRVAKKVLGLSKETIEAKGDLIVGVSPQEVDRLPAGNDGQVLVADSSAPLGVKWENPTSGGGVNESFIFNTSAYYMYGSNFTVDGSFIFITP
jgi:hypothetical protein